MDKKTSEKMPPKKKSKLKSSLDLSEFSKEADLLFKKYKLETGIIVANHNNGAQDFLITCVNSYDQKEEEALLLATQGLFSLVSISSESFFMLSEILKGLREKIEGINPKEGVKLSKSEKNLVEKLREIKNKLVIDKKYEDAIMFRGFEKQILEGLECDKQLILKLAKKYTK